MEDVDEDFPDLEIDYSLPKQMDYDIHSLEAFCRKDSDCALTFYGGEPLLCVDEITRIMDHVRAKLFMIQTNGLLLDRLEPEYVNRLHTILVSIDGDEELTDFHRGKGTFNKILSNLKLIRRNGFSGELIARMTVMEPTDIYRQVKWLLNNEDFSFNSVHWQLNAGFWKSDFHRRDFRRWSEECYNSGTKRLAKFWVDSMEERGIVYRLYPFLGMTHSLLSGEAKNLLRCGGGWVNYAIQTDGNIVPCPTMWGLKDYYLGHISNADPLKLRKVFVDKPCTECDLLGLCGGRCLYANITRRWSPEAYRQVCNTVRNLAEAISEQIPRIQELIEKGVIRIADLEYLKYNGCEIIP